MTKTITIEGMMCNHCEMTVKKALESLDGVTNATVSHEKGTAVVEMTKDVDNAAPTQSGRWIRLRTRRGANLQTLLYPRKRDCK